MLGVWYLTLTLYFLKKLKKCSIDTTFVKVYNKSVIEDGI